MEEEQKKETLKAEETLNLKLNFDFLKNKKVQWSLVILIFALIAIFSVGMRLSNLPLLVDHTTGNYTLSDPDALYWLRLEGHLLTTGNLNGLDPMRNPGLDVPYTQSLVVYTVVAAYKFVHSFNGAITYQFIDAVHPAYAFLIALAIFFFLIYFLTKSKTAALIGSFFLAYSPAFLFRTIAGVSGHEALGIMFLFAVFLSFVLSLKYFEKSWKHSLAFGILTGFLITLSFVAWGGTINFIFLILPISLFLYYIFNSRENINSKGKFLLFYISMVLVSLLSTLLVYYTPSSLYTLFFNPTGVLVPAVFLFALVDFSWDYFKLNYFKKIQNSKFRLLISGGVTVVLGIILMGLFEGGGIGVFSRIYTSLIHPLGTGRVGLTVAYYAQPYLTDFQAQSSIQLFWLFLIGTSFMLIEFFQVAKSTKEKFYLSLVGIVSVIAILFSRYSSSSTFNGVDFISQLVYFLGFVGLVACLIFVYANGKHKIDSTLIFLFSWMVVMLVTVRAAQRTIFLVVPYMVVISSYLLFKLIYYIKNSKKEGMKYLLGAVFILSLILSFIYMFGNPLVSSPGAYYTSNIQAKNTGPLMDQDWQNAMAWVRNNTSSDSVFLHWWDYGYLLQTAGNRTTVLDGGNFNSYWDYLMGRYVLTTPNPATAKSFIKTHNVSYLLIDPTDIGKYAAYSSIGNSENVSDRASYLPTFVSDPRQTQETSNGTTRVYQGAFPLDDDIIFNSSKGPMLLPSGSAGLGAIAVRERNSSYTQPIGVYIYNNQQYQLPIRYMYIGGRLLDFNSGIDATVYIYPSVENQQLNLQGAAMYLSSKTENSLVAQIYLMKDPNNLYPELTLVDEESPYPFNFYYNGFQGPIRIWKVNTSAMSNVLARPEFLAPDGIYGGDDNLTFTK